MRRTRSRAVLSILALSTLLLAGIGEVAAKSPRRVAVLEYRAGTRALPRLGSQLAGLLSRLTALKIAGPEDARRSVSGIDAELAACAGEAERRACGGRISTYESAEKVRRRKEARLPPA